MVVRAAALADLEAVRALLAETWHATYDGIYGRERVDRITAEWHTPPALVAQLERPGSAFLVAELDGAIAGMAYASVVDDGRTVMLHQLYIWPAFQGGGIGRRLLEAVERGFPGAEAMRLEVEEVNAPAVAFYLAHGFAKVGRTDNCGCSGSGIAAALYERCVAGP